jgi:hypothetical protein
MQHTWRRFGSTPEVSVCLCYSVGLNCRPTYGSPIPAIKLVVLYFLFFFQPLFLFLFCNLSIFIMFKVSAADQRFHYQLRCADHLYHGLDLKII